MYNLSIETNDEARSSAQQLNDEGVSSESDCTTNTPRRRLNFSWSDSGYLFGREVEVEKLHVAVSRLLRADNLQSELILISGKSGTGKTALARTIKQLLELQAGFFISGKCDQIQTGEPYAAIVAAFTDLVNLVLSRGKQSIMRVREDIFRVSGMDGQLLLDMIPAFQKIVGNLEPCTLKGEQAQKRQKQIFLDFVLATCSIDCPLVIFMDDVQWADEGSLEILDLLFTKNKIPGLIMVSACRSNEISIDHNFAALLRHLEDKKQIMITHIEVNDISLAATNELISAVLKLSKEACEPLSEIIHRKTQGNVFFTVQFLKALDDDGIFVFESSSERYSWDKKKLEKTVTQIDFVVDLILLKLKQLPNDVQMVLSYAACMGAEVNEQILSKALTNKDVKLALSIAMTEGMIVHEKLNDRLLFSHDRIQQAAYQLISSIEQASAHLYLGRMLLKHLSTEEITNNIFMIVNQFCQRLDAIQDQEEKNLVAALCQRASQKAILSSDFKTATIYLWLGIDLLGKEGWINQYQLTLELHSVVAETEYCSGNFEKMDIAVRQVLQHGRSFMDKVWASNTKVYALFAQNEIQEALSSGLALLDLLGEKFPKPSPFNTIVDFVKTKRLLRGKRDVDILNLPDIDNNQKLQAMGVLNLLTTYTFVAQPNLFPFIGNRMVRLSIKYGICAISAFGFCLNGLFHCLMQNYEEGCRYGNLSLQILERYEKAGFKWIPRVHTLHYGFIAPFKTPIRMILNKILEAHKIGIETGDIEFAMASVRMHSMLSWISGTKLPILAKNVQSNQEMMAGHRQGHWSVMNALHLQMVHNFLGKSQDPLIMQGEVISDIKAELKKANDTDNRNFLSNRCFYNLALACHFGANKLALEYASKIRKDKMMKNLFYALFYEIYEGIAALGMAWQETTSTIRQEKYTRIAKRAVKKFRKLMKLCPSNFENTVLLMEAELSALKNKNMDLMTLTSLYDQAILSANKNGFVQFQALGCERAGLALRERNHESEAKAYLMKAADLYNEWGAFAKVKQMAKDHGLKSSYMQA